jgi:hypothetical protein
MSVELVNEVGVDRQIADEGMGIGEAEDLLFGLFAEESSKIFKAVGAAFERLGTGAIDGAGRVMLDKAAQRHD